ncbi:hypothetical protein JCM3765_006758, partial [Sporobolomyces pararoseus]
MNFSISSIPKIGRARRAGGPHFVRGGPPWRSCKSIWIEVLLIFTPIERRLDRFGAGLSAIRSKALDHVATPALACQVLNEWVEEVLERVKSSQILGNGTKFRNVLDILWVLQHDPTIS